MSTPDRQLCLHITGLGVASQLAHPAVHVSWLCLSMSVCLHNVGLGVGQDQSGCGASSVSLQEQRHLQEPDWSCEVTPHL